MSKKRNLQKQTIKLLIEKNIKNSVSLTLKNDMNNNLTLQKKYKYNRKPMTMAIMRDRYKMRSVKRGNSARLPHDTVVESQRALGVHVYASTETVSPQYIQ